MGQVSGIGESGGVGSLTDLFCRRFDRQRLRLLLCLLSFLRMRMGLGWSLWVGRMEP